MRAEMHFSVCVAKTFMQIHLFNEIIRKKVSVLFISLKRYFSKWIAFTIERLSFRWSIIYQSEIYCEYEKVFWRSARHDFNLFLYFWWRWLWAICQSVISYLLRWFFFWHRIFENYPLKKTLSWIGKRR